jgi:MoaA/NifB/PqqE/SkfB family radical SAM enzyme
MEAPPELEPLLARIRAGETDGIAELAALHESRPADPDILGHLIFACACAGEHARAIALSRRYLELVPDNTEVQLGIADRLVSLGRLDEAADAYQTIAAEHPEELGAVAGQRYVRHLQRRGGCGAEFPVTAPRDSTALQGENERLNREEMFSDRLLLRSMPTHLYLESTTKCNFACQTCSKGYDPYYAEDVSPAILAKVRREIMPTNVNVSITGFGEPTLAGNFDEILTMAIANGSAVHFVTNASPLSIDRLEQLARTVVGITISIDGATKETFERVRTGGNFERTLERLAMIQRLRRIHLSQRFGTWHFNFVALRSNIHELPDVVRLAKRFDIDSVGVADYALGQGEFDAESLRNDPELANRWLAESRRVAEELGVTLQLPPEYSDHAIPTTGLAFGQRIRRAGRLLPVKRRFPQKCANPWNNPYIRTDGTVVPCCASGHFMGSLRRSSFREIWNGWRYRVLRWRIHSVLPPLECRNCFVCWGINGGNAGNVIAKEGLLIKGIYSCEVRGRAVARRLRKIRALWRRPAPAPRPNYYRGRPLTERNRPAPGNQIPAP